MLRKDFLFTAEQLYESRAMGADAVLLVMCVFDRLHATGLAAPTGSSATGPSTAGPLSVVCDLLVLSRELGLGALVEVADERELAAALAAGADIIGVNHRGLRAVGPGADVLDRSLLVWCAISRRTWSRLR